MCVSFIFNQLNQQLKDMEKKTKKKKKSKITTTLVNVMQCNKVKYIIMQEKFQ